MYMYCVIGLSSYKLAQFVSEYVRKNRPDLGEEVADVADVEDNIVAGGETTAGQTDIRKKPGIRARTARKWLRRLGFRWQEVRKGVFIDGHERPDVVEHRKQFVDKIEELSPYLVEFMADGSMKEKLYPIDCEIGGLKRSIIIITHDEAVFSANDGKHQAWCAPGEHFLRPKGKGKGIMVSDFLLPWSRLNLFSLPKRRQEELEEAGVPLEAAVLFEYGKEDGYWDGKMLLRQALDRALPVATALYPGYSFLFLFDNVTSHSVYADNALLVSNMNKRTGGQQAFLRDGWFHDGNTRHVQEMWFTKMGNPVRIQKGVERVLRERGLWPAGGLNLECSKPKCHGCKSISTCQVCIKGVTCDSCKQEKIHSTTCTTSRACDACIERQKRCACVPKKYCPTCAADCEKLPPRCTSESESILPVIQTYIFSSCPICRLLCPPATIPPARFYGPEM
jgi:hypothetical protein